MDDIEQRIRAANASPVRRNSPLSERAKLDLTLIVQEPRASHFAEGRRRTRRTILVSTVAAMAVIALTVLGAVVFTPHAAMASPPLLSVTTIDGSVTQILGKLSRAARALPAPTSTVIRAETWSADITVKDRVTTEFVQPSEVVRTRLEDLSGEVVTYASGVRWGSAPAGVKVPRKGSELTREKYAAGTYPILFPVAPPDSSGSYAAYFHQYAGTQADSSPGDYFRAIADLRNDWAFNGPQTGAVLDFVGQLPDVSIAGEVTDRLGRPGVAIQTTTRGGGAFRDLLVFDKSTGALLSAEQIYLGGLKDVRLDFPSVLDYIAWKDQQ